MKIFKSFPVFWLMIAIIFELGFQTWWNKQWGEYISPTVLLLAGLFTCWIAYRMIAFKKQPIPLAENKGIDFRKSIVIFGIFLVGMIIVGLEYHQIMLRYPVSEDGHNSDVIPSLILYVRRFLGGEFAYQPLEFDGWTVMPTYFPMMWLPYSFSELLDIDYRWTAYLVFLIPLFIYQIRLSRQDLSVGELGFKAALPFVMLYVFMVHVDSAFGYGVELMPIGLYFLLTLVLDKKQNWLIAIPIVFVLLSRYAFTFWLPVFMLSILIEKGFWKAFKISMWVVVGVLLLYVIPFLSKDWKIFSEGLEYYAHTAESIWEAPHFRTSDGRIPSLLVEGLSHSIYFWENVDGTVVEKLNANRMFHILICGLAAIVLFLGYWKNRNKGLNIPIYFLIGLKFYLIIFYCFFYVPFRYLYQLPMLLTIPILYNIPLWKNEKMLKEE